MCVLAMLYKVLFVADLSIEANAYVVAFVWQSCVPAAPFVLFRSQAQNKNAK